MKALLWSVILALCMAVGARSQSPQQPDGLNVAILVDITASMHRCPEGVAGLVSTTVAGSATSTRLMNDRSLIAPAVAEFPLSGPRSGDRVRVGAIGRQILLSDAYKGDSPELRTAWRGLFGLPPVEWLGPSPLWDAIAHVADFLSAESGFRAIVLISDGQASGNLHSAAEAAEVAVKAGVRVSTIGLESILSTTPPRTMASAIGKDPTDRLREMAEKTGGRFALDKAVVTPGVPCYTLDPARQLAQAIADLRVRAKAR